MEQNKNFQRLNKVFVFLTFLGLLLITCRMFLYYQNQREVEGVAKAQAHNEAVTTAKEIEEKLKQLMVTTQSLADELSQEKLDQDGLQMLLREKIQQNQDIYGLGVAYVPTPGMPLYAPYYARVDGELRMFEEGSLYDYTETDWYKTCLEQGAVWLEPYYGKLTGELQVKYSVPFYKTNASGKREVAGVVYINHSLEYVKDMMSALDLGKTGYGYILSQQGVLISYPITEYVVTRKTLFDLAKEQKNDGIQELAIRQLQGEKGFYQYENEVTGQNSWVFYEPIPSTGWSVGTVFITDELFADSRGLKRAFIQISLLVVVFSLPALIILFRAHRGNERQIWQTSFAYSLVLASCICAIWFLTLHYPESQGDLVMVEKSSLDQFIHQQTSVIEGMHQKTPVFVPTGIFLQSLQIIGANDVAVTGYVWQKYTRGKHEGLSQGVIFPESISPDDRIEESYRRTEGNTEVVGWYFNVVLRQNFSYAKYPFDRKDVWIRMWHRDFDKGVILVPDLKAYRLTNPESCPGLEKNLVISGFRLESSYFSFVQNSYNTNFGISKFVGQKDFPELYFKVLLSREFQDPFISNLLPILVIAWILFGILIIVTKQDEVRYIGEFNFSSLLASCAGLFFSVLLAHINLRSQFPVKEILYLEYFFLTLYFAILVIVFNAFLFAADKELPLVHYKDHLIPKILYWPVILFFLLMVTVWKFY